MIVNQNHRYSMCNIKKGCIIDQVEFVPHGYYSDQEKKTELYDNGMFVKYVDNLFQNGEILFGFSFTKIKDKNKKKEDILMR